MADIKVNAGQNLQTAIDTAKGGDTVTVEAGATFDQVSLRDKASTSIVAIRSSSPGQPFTINSADYQPALQTVGRASNYDLDDVKLTHSGNFSYGLAQFGDYDETVKANLSRNFNIRRMIAVSSDDKSKIVSPQNQNTKRAIDINCIGINITDSKFFGLKGEGQDSQAIFVRQGGDVVIDRCYLEGAGENFLTGGAYAAIKEPCWNIQIRNTYFFKPLHWKGSIWQVKNLFELKSVIGCIVDNCKLENNWPAAQQGLSVLFTVRGDGNATSTVQNVTFKNSQILNVHGGFNLLPADDTEPSTEMKDIFITGNTVTGINTLLLQVLPQPTGGGKNIHFKHNTFRANAGMGSAVSLDGTGKMELFVEDNDFGTFGEYGVHGSGMAEGQTGFYAFCTPNSTFKKNLFYFEGRSWVPDPGYITAAYPNNYALATKAEAYNADGKPKAQFLGGDGQLVGSGVNVVIVPPPTVPPTVPPMLPKLLTAYKKHTGTRLTAAEVKIVVEACGK